MFSKENVPLRKGAVTSRSAYWENELEGGVIKGILRRVSFKGM